MKVKMINKLLKIMKKILNEVNFYLIKKITLHKDVAFTKKT